MAVFGQFAATGQLMTCRRSGQQLDCGIGLLNHSGQGDKQQPCQELQRAACESRHRESSVISRKDQNMNRANPQVRLAWDWAPIVRVKLHFCSIHLQKLLVLLLFKILRR